MGLGREVADAYISVHGDLTDFRNDLNKAGDMTEKLAMEQAQAFADAWADRIDSEVNGKWQSIIDAMYSDKKLDWDRLVGKFDANGNLDEAEGKILEFMSGMQKAGQLTEEEWIKADDALKGMLGNLRELREAQQDLDEQKRESIRLQEAMVDGEKAAAAIRSRIYDDAVRENERWARSFDGITKTAAIRNLNDDFRKLTEAMAAGDMHGFAKRFDEDWGALRTRVMEVTDAMVQQRRISEENRRKIHDAIDDHIQMEDQLRQATARTTTEVAYAKIAQDQYNKSLEGMIEAAQVKRLEQDFRNLAAAIDSGNWDAIKRGHTDMAGMRFAVGATATEMRRLGRITDATFDTVMRTVGSLDLNFKKATTSSRTLGSSLSRNNVFLSVFARGLENIAGKMKGLAGFNVVGDVFRDGGQFIADLDRNAVKIAKLTVAIGGFASVIGSSIGGIATISSDIAKAAGGLALLGPAFLTGAGIGIGVLVASFKDMKEVLKDLGPQFDRLQDTISKKFWEQAEEPIRNLTKSLFPTLTKQLEQTGDAMGDLVGTFAKAFQDTATPERVTVMFERMNDAIRILKRAMAPLTRAFVNLGDVGSKYFGRFAEWLVQLSEQFDAFIQKAFDNGDLDKWIEAGIQGMKDLGSAIHSTTRMFGAISDAARAAGSKGLAGFAENMRGIADFMESPRFQKALTGVFDGFYATLNGIKLGFLAVGRGLEAFVPTFQRISGSLGQVFETLGIYIEKFLKNKSLQDGVERFVAGIATALNNLSPAIEPIANSLGQLFSFMGEVLENVATIISKIVTTWGPSFDKMLAAIQPLVKPVTDLALVFIEKMGPVFEKFVDEVLPPLVDLFIQLLPLIELLVTLITPVLIDLLEKMGKFFSSLADGMREFNKEAGPAITEIKKVADEIKNVKLPDEIDLGGLGAGNFAAKIGIALAKTQPGITAAIGSFLNTLTGNLQRSFKTAVNFGGMLSDLFSPATMPATLADIAADVVVWANGVIKGFTQGWDGFVAGIKGMFIKLYEGVKTEFQNFMRSLLGLGPAGPKSDASVSVGAGGGGVGRSPSGKLDPSILGMGEPEGMFDELIIKVQEELGKFFGSIGENLAGFGAGVKLNWDNFWGGLGTKIQEVWDGAVLWIQTKAEEIRINIETWSADIKLKWDTFWGEVGTTISTKWTEFWTTVSTKAAEIKLNIETFANDVKTNWNNFWTEVGTTISTKWTEFWTTVSTKATEIKTGISNFGNDVKTNWNNFWGEVGRKVDEAWKGIKSGVETGIKNVLDFFRNLPGDITAAVGDMFSKGSGIGSDIVSGMQSGINGGIQWVKDAAANVAKAAVDAAKWVLEINSPSKAFRRLGLGGGAGMAQGFDWSESRVAQAAAAMASAATDVVTEEFARSKMYTAGMNAALGLAAGLKDSKPTLATALGDLLPDASASVRISGSSQQGVGGSTPSKVVNIENLSMPITTPTKDPALVASKTIDGFVAVTNF